MFGAKDVRATTGPRRYAVARATIYGMALLRERPAPDTVASINLQVRAKHARDALDRRLTQLEAEHADFQHTLAAVEQAVKWLPDTERVRARRRLRDLGLAEQPDALRDLHHTLDDAA